MPDVGTRTTLELDSYEVANLYQGLLFLREVGGDTGDWLVQILLKLPDPGVPPNKSVQEQKADLARLIGWRLLWPR